MSSPGILAGSLDRIKLPSGSLMKGTGLARFGNSPEGAHFTAEVMYLSCMAA
ncbi:MAG: hypothetical protein KGL98_01460 [Gammaproteobacteria bacterium]|nr:hypothetical protein [Gammaproteobacteria bacterium]